MPMQSAHHVVMCDDLSFPFPHTLTSTVTAPHLRLCETARERQTERQTKRKRERESDRERETERQRERESERGRQRER